MTACVFRSREPALYPLEWTLLGRPAAARGRPTVETTIADKVATITDARALRLFLWKLHNAVSSSISRQEEWYQRRGSVLYTNRFWPSLESELSRAKALRSATVPRTRLEAIHATLPPSVRLGHLREALLAALERKDGAAVEALCAQAAPVVTELEEAMLASKTLGRYEFNPDKEESNPAFSPEEEEYSRGGVFEVL